MSEEHQQLEYKLVQDDNCAETEVMERIFNEQGADGWDYAGPSGGTANNWVFVRVKDIQDDVPE